MPLARGFDAELPLSRGILGLFESDRLLYCCGLGLWLSVRIG